MTLTQFDDSWKEWIRRVLFDGMNKQDVFIILLNHGYSYDVIESELEITPVNNRIVERKKSQLELNKESDISLGILYKPLADNPKVHRIESNFLEIYRIYDFLTKDECLSLLNEMGNNFTPSTVTNPNADKYDRTSSTCNMLLNNTLYNQLNQKIHDFMKIPVNMGEVPQGQKYKVGQEFKPHTDYFHLNEEYNKKHIEFGGQRTWTFMIYLNDVEEGGSTKFIKINKEFFPSTGDVLVWNNVLPNQVGNPYSLHCGMPVIKGEKNIITKWFRER